MRKKGEGGDDRKFETQRLGRYDVLDVFCYSYLHPFLTWYIKMLVPMVGIRGPLAFPTDRSMNAGRAPKVDCLSSRHRGGGRGDID